MQRFATFTLALAVLLSFSGAAAPAQQEKPGDLLRYKFTKGEEFTFQANGKITLEFKEMPEEFQGLFGEDNAIDLKFSVVMGLTVDSVKEGKAELSGEFRKLSIEGNMIMQELDFHFDAEKDKGKKREKKGQDDEFGEDPFGFDIEGAMQQLVQQPLILTIDERGNMQSPGGDALGMGGGMSLPFLTLNGFMGALPKEKVAKGAAWKVDSDFPIPNLPMQVDLTANNTYEGRKEVEGLDCAVIRSKFSVASTKKKDDNSELPIQLKAEMTGEGEGTTAFAIEAGHMVKTEAKVTVNIKANLESPDTGDEMTIKAALGLSQTITMTKGKTETKSKPKY